MKTIEFSNSKPFSLGAELEVQLVDQHTLDLYPGALDILKGFTEEKNWKVKAEIFQSMMELNTGICSTAFDLESELKEGMLWLKEKCAERGLFVVSMGTHPFAKYSERLVFPDSRYHMLMERHQWIARRLVIFGLHLHIGMRSGDHCIEMLRKLTHFTPHLLALSTSSPFWQGEDTKLASARSTLFESIPTGGHPCIVKNWSHFQQIVNVLTMSRSIKSLKDIWWDVRPSPGFGTLEVRICDSPTSLKQIAQIAAFTHCLCLALDAGEFLERIGTHQDWLVRENKWRVVRNGMDSEILISDDGRTSGLREDLDQLLDHLKPVFTSVGYSDYFSGLKQQARSLSSSERQRKVHEGSGSLKEVVLSALSELEN